MAIRRSTTLEGYIRRGQAPVSLPLWLAAHVDFRSSYSSHEERMRLAIRLSELNVRFKTGGPFGAAIFDRRTSRLLGVGVNRVVPTHDPTAHAETTAFRVALGFLRNFSFQEVGIAALLYSSADPCGMCCTATLWSGVSHLYAGASRADVERIGFDEGLRPRNWRHLLNRRGVQVTTGLLRAEAAAVLRTYAGLVYNGRRRSR